MSVVTTADEKIIAAKQNLSDAKQNIWAAINPETWGANDFSQEYKENLVKAFQLLLSIEL